MAGRGKDVALNAFSSSPRARLQKGNCLPAQLKIALRGGEQRGAGRDNGGRRDKGLGRR